MSERLTEQQLDDIMQWACSSDLRQKDGEELQMLVEEVRRLRQRFEPGKQDARYDPALAELWTREPFLTLHDDICTLGQNYAIRTGMRLREIVLAPVTGVKEGDTHHVATPFGIVAVTFSRSYKR